MNVYKYSVTPENADENRQITIPSLCSYAINAIAQNVRKEGYGVDVLAAEKKTWILLRSAFEIDERPSIYEPISISVWPVDSGNGLIYHRCVRIYDSCGVEIARGTTEWCVIDLESRRPVISDLKVKKSGLELPCKEPKRLIDFEPQEILSRKVGYSECDFNGHLNNIKYLDILFDMLPEYMLEQKSGIRLDINYRHEVGRGATISAGLKQESEGRFLFIARSGIQTLCRASLIAG